jgi:DNA-binding NarL/FixJ family response regulator
VSARPPIVRADQHALDADASGEVSDAVVVLANESSRPVSAELDAPSGPPRQVPPFKRLTDLERTLLEVMADGHSVAAAAGLLGIKARTARARIERARERNNCRSTTALIRSARENGELAGSRELPD